MKKLFYTQFILVLFSVTAKGISISGTVTDYSTHEKLIGVTVTDEKMNGTITNDSGYFSMDLSVGSHQLEFSYLGYEKFTSSIEVSNGMNPELSIRLIFKNIELDQVVISGSKFEKKLSEETVSMEVLKPQLIENSNSIEMDEALNKMPGVNIVDGQANIRGGSGYAYGAGSRVLVLVDDMPQLSADANDVKWESLPTENLDQIEIIKGASSVLYGSSALNGIINIRTAYPTSKPLTKISFYTGIFDNPKNDSLVWWGNEQPFFTGGSFFHSQKFGPLDLVVGGNLAEEQSYLHGEYFTRGRLNANTRYRFKNMDGLSAGINTNVVRYESGTFFIWAADTAAFEPYGGFDPATSSLSEGKYTRFNLDPFITYFSPNGDKYSVKSRYYLTDNQTTDTAKSANAKLYYADFQYQKHFQVGLSMVIGASGSSSVINSGLYGSHNANNKSVYLQFEQKIGKLTAEGGMRYESFCIDTDKGKSQPVFRAGLNYQIGIASFLRASFGQGYRFPSVAEKYTRTNIGSIVVFPNPDVEAETGQSAEIGFKQGFKIDQWLGYVDIAGFANWYQNFMEFRFGYYPPFVDTSGFINPAYIGFKSVNVENAKITGTEISIIANGKLFGLPLTLLTGYSFINPIDVDAKKRVDSLLNNDQSLTAYEQDSISQLQYLKYRYKQTIKFDAEISVHKFSTGLSFQYTSFMINIDPFFTGTDPIILQLTGGVPFEFVPGISEYRNEHKQGDYFLDWRLAYQINENVKAAFIVKNITNNEYTQRPAMLEAPRNFALQVSMKF